MVRFGRRNTRHGLRHLTKGLDMAKAQKRSTREIRKPKAEKNKAAPVVGLAAAHPVNALMNKPKTKG